MTGGGATAATKSEQPPMQGLAYVVRVYSLLALISLATFGLLHIFADGDSTLGYLEITGAGLCLLNFLLLNVTHKVTLARDVLLCVILLFILLMLVSGGTHNTGIFWYYIFPVGAFFLSGKRRGMFWVGALIAGTGALWLLAARHVITLPYDGITIRQLLASLVVVSVGIAAYQGSRELLEQQGRASKTELQNERMRSDVIVQNIGEGIIVTDPEGSVTFMNMAAERLLGWRASDVIGKSFLEVVPMIDASGELVEPQNRPLFHSLRTGLPMSTIATYQTKDGHTIPVSVTGTPIIMNDKVIGAIGTFRDFSEEQNVARAKSEFVTLASHQLRTPLSAVAWVSELLLSGDAGPLSPEQREHIQNIYRSNRRMTDLVGEMLLVASLDLNELPVRLKPVRIAEAAKEVLRDQLTIHKGKQLQIMELYDWSVPPVSCDEDILRLLLSNLLSNAMKYTPNQGKITLTVGVDHQQRLRDGSDGSVVITVHDNGYGIPEEATNKIFSKFFRADNILHRDTDGTGLGLYIVKSLIDYVGGRVTFTSTVGQGTAFTVVLPLEGMRAHKHDSTKKELKST